MNEGLQHSVMVVPRTTAEIAFRSGEPVELDLEAVRSKFDLRLSDAAKALGISITSLKQACRKLGVARWPRRRLQPRATSANPTGSAIKLVESDSDDQAPVSLGSFRVDSGFALSTGALNRAAADMQHRQKRSMGPTTLPPLLWEPSTHR